MKQVSEGAAVVVGGVTVTPINRTSVNALNTEPHMAILGSKSPVALLISTPNGSLRVELELKGE